MDTLLIIITLLLLLILILILVVLLRPRSSALEPALADLSRQLEQLRTGIREESRAAREENAAHAGETRRELAGTLHTFRSENADHFNGVRTTLSTTLKDFATEQRQNFEELKKEQKELTEKTVAQLEKITRTLDEKLNAVNTQMKTDGQLSRDSIEKSLTKFGDTFRLGVDQMNNLLREKFGQLEDKQNKLVDTTEKKLEQMRETVEEKLHKTLHERLGQSFELVRGQLESVQKGLGEMQTLAQDVGGLKRVLSNVKMRGGFGEVQLQMLLESILAPEQYEANVTTKIGSSERVEFAVKFPNKEGDREYIWLPIDAKFPRDAYQYLQDAYDTADPGQIEAAQKALEAVIRKMAKDICEKYIDAPNTTNFGIMFLPFEGLFAEVVRKASLLEEIQRDCKVIITGPTTLAVILNSLQMGFRTLAIQKRSSEVWQVLGAVKKEFTQFGGMLEKAQKNIQTGLNQLEEVSGRRTRAIQRQLKGVEVLEEEKGEVLELVGGGEEVVVDTPDVSHTAGYL